MDKVEKKCFKSDVKSTKHFLEIILTFIYLIEYLSIQRPFHATIFHMPIPLYFNKLHPSHYFQ